MVVQDASMHLIMTHKENLRHLMGRGSGVSISIRLLTQKMELHVQIGNVHTERSFLVAGVGIFTPSGESLAMLAADKINIKGIGVLANNVLLNAQKASIDMGTGRGQLVHVEAERAHIIVRCRIRG